VAATPPPSVPTPDEGDIYFHLTVEQYHQMIKSGILTEDDPVELLEGLLVQKMPKNPPHQFSRHRLFRWLNKSIPEGWLAWTENPVTTAESEPEPDISVIRGNDELFRDRHPRPEETALLIEVADSSVYRDRGRKKRIYARAKIPAYWIVNLVDKVVEVYTE